MDENKETEKPQQAGRARKSAGTPCYTVLDLFSGIGGFSLGLERTGGFKTIAFCEQDEFCKNVLSKHWPEIPIYDDVRTIENVKADVVTGGYPCQPFSVAGSQKAAEDDRHLWPEMLRVITQTRTTWVIAENVYGHVALGLDKVLFDLEGQGYSARPIIIPACATGRPHRRDRVYIVAYSASNGRNESKTSPGDETTNGYCEEGKDKDSDHERLSSLRSELAWGSNTFRGGGAEPPEIRVDDGLPNRMDRNKCLGNSLIPQIPEMIGRMILGV